MFIELTQLLLLVTQSWKVFEKKKESETLSHRSYFMFCVDV